MSSLKIGVQLSVRCDSWGELAAAAARVDGLGYDYLFLPDHLMPLSGPEDVVTFEGIAGTAALAASTSSVNIGLLVGSNTFRNPGLFAKSVATIDHVSGGRAILGLGGGWHVREHEAFGVEFGASPGRRLTWLDEALSVIRPLLHGETVTHHGERYSFENLVLSPKPVQERLPILVGGGGEKKTLPTAARYADMWNAQSDPETSKRKIEVLRRNCDAIGRDFAEIECSIDSGPLVRSSEQEALSALEQRSGRRPDQRPPWVGTPEQLAEHMLKYTALGFTTLTCALGAPYDEETLTRLVGEVKPLVDQAA